MDIDRKILQIYDTDVCIGETTKRDTHTQKERETSE